MSPDTNGDPAPLYRVKQLEDRVKHLENDLEAHNLGVIDIRLKVIEKTVDDGFKTMAEKHDKAAKESAEKQDATTKAIWAAVIAFFSIAATVVIASLTGSFG